MTDPAGDSARPRRRRGRRHRRPAGPAQTDTRRRAQGRRTVQEYSAGGLVVDGLDRETQLAALIGKAGRRGRMCWTLPKGHIEIGETAEQAAMREIAEETGIRGDVVAPLGSVDYWFRAQDQAVHKTVHHYLLVFLDGELSTNDHEVDEVAWVPLDELASRLTHADERELVEVAAHLVAILRTRGKAALPALPRNSPWRRAQTHSAARRRSSGGPTPQRTNTRNPDPRQGT